MTEDDLQDRRRANLRTWIEQKGGTSKALAGRSNVSSSYPSFLAQVLAGHSFGSRAARKCEAVLGMPSQWLDGNGTRAPTPQPAPRPDLKTALPVVLDAIGELSGSQWAMVRAALDYLVSHRDEHSQTAFQIEEALTRTTTGVLTAGAESKQRVSNG